MKVVYFYYLLLPSLIQISEAKEVCYDDIGCFSTDYPFTDGLKRPVAVLPWSPDEIDTRFYLYTRQNPTTDKKQTITFKANSISTSNFNGKKKTFIIVHGFRDNALEEWMVKMREALLRNGDYNVITVDWQKGAKYPYMQATANTRVVGAMIAQLVNSLITNTPSTENKFHIIGHSLGAHIAGYAGERIPNLAKITGMDPAGPWFENTHPKVRLDPSDAKFVEAIHTDTEDLIVLGFGIKMISGHVDFYVNGGSQQPGCTSSLLKKLVGIVWSEKNLEYYAIEAAMACSHNRVLDLFTESIGSSCQFNGMKCESWKKFEIGECLLNEQAVMGFQGNNTTKRGIFYVRTTKGSPFCGKHYKVTMKIANDQDRAASGMFNFVLQGSEGSSYLQFNSKPQEIRAGITYRNVATGRGRHIGTLHKVKLKFVKQCSVSGTCWMYSDAVKFNTITLFDPTLSKKYKIEIGSNKLKSGVEMTFIANQV